MSHCTSNKNGQEEITLQSYWPAWKSLTLSIAELWNERVAYTNRQVFVKQGTVWVNKATGKTPGPDMQFELFEVKDSIKRRYESF